MHASPQLQPPQILGNSPRRRSTATKQISVCINDFPREASLMEPGALVARNGSRPGPAANYMLRSSLPPKQTTPAFYSADNQLCAVEESENDDSDIYNDDRDDETLSYEECLLISETLGDVKQDEWMIRAEGEINKLAVEVFEETNNSTEAEECACLVCLQQYEGNDVVRKLPCGHAFHICCADQWLMRANACPCCRKPIAED